MDLMSVRRGLMGQVPDSKLWELVQTIHLDQDAKSFVIDTPRVGFYIFIMNPIVTKADAIAKGDYTFVAGDFIIHADASPTFNAGQIYVFKSDGTTTYWGTSMSWVDDSHKQITVQPGRGYVWLLGDHDVMIYRLKTE